MATLDLINRLVREEAGRHLLIIGAYRDNEVDADHPLMLTIESLRRAGAPPTELTLGPLERGEVAELVAETVENNETPNAENASTPKAQQVSFKVDGMT